jgi:hypothetical protein
VIVVRTACLAAWCSQGREEGACHGVKRVVLVLAADPTVIYELTSPSHITWKRSWMLLLRAGSVSNCRGRPCHGASTVIFITRHR